jgi:hypothetical protein
MMPGTLISPVGSIHHSISDFQVSCWSSMAGLSRQIDNAAGGWRRRSGIRAPGGI